MHTRRPPVIALICATGGLLAACTQTIAPAAAQQAHAGKPIASAAAALPEVHVHKDANCGCCSLWVNHLRDAGFKVKVTDTLDMGAVKQRVGVPYGKGSCHTAEVGGYFIEGHVPVQDIKRLLAQRPAAKGLVLPGMPLGSPGMEVPSGVMQPYTVELVGKDGTTRQWSRHGTAGR
ncbi:MAG TPA: DUF411 domain-containing protein [Pseudoxanthomonas sp.]|nr:DUF411 domain-containing protein [Pseudoxanthomonas sp.]